MTVATQHTYTYARKQNQQTLGILQKHRFENQERQLLKLQKSGFQAYQARELPGELKYQHRFQALPCGRKDSVRFRSQESACLSSIPEDLDALGTDHTSRNSSMETEVTKMVSKAQKGADLAFWKMRRPGVPLFSPLILQDLRLKSPSGSSLF